MLGLLKNSMQDFRRTYKKYIIFAFIYMLMTNFIFVPIIAYVFNRVLTAMGSGPLLNSDIFKIVLNYRGIAAISIISILSIAVLFIEFGVFIIISHKKYFGEDIFISDAVVTTIRKTPKILGFGALHLIFFQFFLIPFIELPLTLSLVENINLPILIRGQVMGSYLFTVLYMGGIVAVGYIILRWIFTLHYIMLEGKSIKDAITCSLELTQKNKINTLIKLLLLNIVFFAIGFMIISSINFIPYLIDINIEGFFIENYLITFSSFIAYIFALLVTPVNIIFLTRLYYLFNKRKGIREEDRLKIYDSKLLKRLERKLQGLFNRRKYVVLMVLLINLVATFMINYAVNDNIIYLGRNVLIAGHRGDPIVAPENSLSSIRSAIEKGVEVIEIDVQKTKDGVIVLNHDIDLMRVAGVPYAVSDLTYEEISELDIGYLFSSEFTGEGIPTLAEVLQEAKGRAKVIVEIKPYGDSKELAENTVAVIEEYDMVEDSYVQSFNYNILKEVRQLNSDIIIGQVMYYAAGRLASLDVDFYAIEQSMLSNKFVKDARRMNRGIWVWTVNKEIDIKEVLKYDIDGIITDYPERVQEIIGFGL